MKKTENTYRRYPRRDLSKVDICVPEQSLSIRTLINRVSKGQPINAKLNKHIPLPDDGHDINDYETGTEEIVDVTDAEAYASKIRAQQAYIAKQKEEEFKKQSELSQTAPPTHSEATQ